MVLCALAIGCAVLVRSDGPEGSGLDLFVVGDSVTFLAAGEIQAEYAGDRTQFVAKPGFTSKDLLPLVRQAMAGGTGSGSGGRRDTPATTRDRVVALVGYNDVRVRDLDGAALPALVEETSRFRCAVWLSLPARPGGKVARNEFVPSRLVDQFNRRLAEEVDKYPNVHLADDWKSAVEGAPTSELLRPDHVHPNDAGQQRLAAAYKAATDRYC